MQHNLITRLLCTNRLILAPNLILNAGDKVLDAATGTGIWLTQLASQVPSGVGLIGTDANSRLFPSPSQPNVTFRKASTTRLPSEWSNSFKLVNQRLLVSAFTEAQWRQVLKEIHRVLAPGGQAQFVEVHLPLNHSGPKTLELERLIRSLYEAHNLHYSVATMLPTMLAATGFVNIHHETKTMPLGSWGGEDGTSSADNVLAVFVAKKEFLLKAELIRKEDYDTLLEEVKQEWDEQSGTSKVFIFLQAEKPV